MRGVPGFKMQFILFPLDHHHYHGFDHLDHYYYGFDHLDYYYHGFDHLDHYNYGFDHYSYVMVDVPASCV